jgi:iron-sulfur cluster repair protein YtfE (RIC family)
MDLDTALTDKPGEGASATDILRADHQEVRRLFGEQRRAGTDEHAARVLAQDLCMQIELHDRIERDVLYPVLRDIEAGWAREALAAHDEIARALEQLRIQADARERLTDTVPRLEALVEKHLMTEEQCVFPRLEAESGVSLVELGCALIKRKEELTQETSSLEGPAT